MRQNLIFNIFFLSLLVSGCGSSRQYFQIEEASYSPAVLNESSRLTTVEVLASHVDTNVEFTSIVFNNLRIPVVTEEVADGVTKITGYIQIGGKLMEDHYQKMTEEPNRLYYRIERRERYVDLKNVERQRTEIPEM